MKMTISQLHDRFISGYGVNSSYYKNASEENKQLLETVYSFLQSGIHPCAILTTQAIDTLISITNVDFKKIECPDAPQTILQIETTQLTPDDIPSTAICKNYSCGSNLSVNYQYANEVSFGTCASDKIPSMYCTYAFGQSSCPFFKADYGLFATHVIDENSVYKSYKERTASEYVISVYDSSNNLLTRLNYPPSVISEIPSGTLEEEISEIIKTIHKSTFDKENCSFVSDFSSVSELSEAPSKSYISSLIS